MQAKFFPYECEDITPEGARLVAWKYKDVYQRPSEVIIKGTQIKKGDYVDLAFVHTPAAVTITLEG